MSDILNAVNAVKPLIQALDGLRLISPFLEKMGSLEQSVAELENIRVTTYNQCSEAKEDLKGVNIELATAKRRVKELLEESKDSAEKIITNANVKATETIKNAEKTATEKIGVAEAAVNKIYEEMSVRISEDREKHDALVKEIEVQEAKLITIREMLAKFNGV